MVDLTWWRGLQPEMLQVLSVCPACHSLSAPVDSHASGDSVCCADDVCAACCALSPRPGVDFYRERRIRHQLNLLGELQASWCDMPCLRHRAPGKDSRRAVAAPNLDLEDSRLGSQWQHCHRHGNELTPTCSPLFTLAATSFPVIVCLPAGDRRLNELGDKLCENLEVFFEDVAGDIKPSVLHGDLWRSVEGIGRQSGSKGRGGGGCALVVLVPTPTRCAACFEPVCSGNIAGVEGKPAIFDPATYYGACWWRLLDDCIAVCSHSLGCESPVFACKCCVVLRCAV